VLSRAGSFLKTLSIYLSHRHPIITDVVFASEREREKTAAPNFHPSITGGARQKSARAGDGSFWGVRVALSGGCGRLVSGARRASDNRGGHSSRLMNGCWSGGARESRAHGPLRHGVADASARQHAAVHQVRTRKVDARAP